MNRTPRRLDGNTLSQILKAQGRRQDWFAEQVGVSQSNVTRWCNGSLAIGEEYIEKIADVLGIPLFLISEFHKRNETESSVQPTEAA